jgi:hypothetical protein
MLDPSRAVVREPSLRSGWSLTVCPDAGEAGGCFVPKYRRTPSRGGFPDEARARQEAARRARGRLRRYCAANRLNRLGTLTYAPPFCTDPAELRSDLASFFRELRGVLGGRPFPYVWVPEYHGDGKRFHAHFAVGRYIHWRKVRDAWGHGHVGMDLIGDLPVGSGRLQEARYAAGYLSKYVTKSLEDSTIRGRHRYDVAQGFQPARVRVCGDSVDEAIGAAAAMFDGVAPTRSWFSSEQKGWRGAPALWVQW